MFPSFPEQSKVWVYQSGRELTDEEVSAVDRTLAQFTQQWTAHQQALKATSAVLFKRFVVLVVDETMAGASGCSIDKSVHFMKELGNALQTDFFDRMTFAFMNGEQVETAASGSFAQKYQSGELNDETVVFNNLVSNLGELRSNWQVRLGESWHKRFV